MSVQSADGGRVSYHSSVHLGPSLGSSRHGRPGGERVSCGRTSLDLPSTDHYPSGEEGSPFGLWTSGSWVLSTRTDLRQPLRDLLKSPLKVPQTPTSEGSPYPTRVGETPKGLPPEGECVPGLGPVGPPEQYTTPEGPDLRPGAQWTGDPGRRRWDETVSTLLNREERA